MSKLPVVSGADLVKALQKCNFVVIRQRGSHIVMQRRNEQGVVTTVVPDHKEIARGTLRTILRKISMNPDELSELL